MGLRNDIRKAMAGVESNPDALTGEDVCDMLASAGDWDRLKRFTDYHNRLVNGEAVSECDISHRRVPLLPDADADQGLHEVIYSRAEVKRWVGKSCCPAAAQRTPKP